MDRHTARWLAVALFVCVTGCEKTSPEVPEKPAPARPKTQVGGQEAEIRDQNSEVSPTAPATQPTVSSQPASAPVSTADSEVVEENWPNGKPKNRRQVKRDAYGNIINHGRYASWYENGNKQAEGEHLEGEQEGIWTYWHEDGRKKAEGQMIRGKTSGAWKYWYPDGKIKEQSWVNDRAEGPITVWHANGKMAQTGTFVNGQADGKFSTWDEDGNLLREQVFERGKLVSDVTAPDPLPTTQPE